MYMVEKLMHGNYGVSHLVDWINIVGNKLLVDVVILEMYLLHQLFILMKQQLVAVVVWMS